MRIPHAFDLRRMLEPRHVAVIGASGDAGKFGGRVMHFLVKHRYAGRIVPVNRTAKEILGHAAYRDIREAPGPIDVALLAVPAPELQANVAACGEAGVECCVVITADFAEVGAAGEARERELVATARRHGMRLLGPNCLGYINPHASLALTSSVALAMTPMPRGSIALVSQSGSLMASVISHARDCGAGFTAAVTVGNQADLELCDFIEHFVDDDATRAICLYVEGLKDGARFLAAAERCRAAGKPLLAVKAGRSDAGTRIARSHTASLAGSYAVWEAACREHAVCLLDDAEAMIRCAHFLVAFGPPRSDGVAALSPSGGTIAITADRLAAAGLRLAHLSPATRDTLARLVPAARELNPLDVGGLARDQGLPVAKAAQAAYASDPDVGVTLIAVATTPQLDDKVRAWGSAAIAARAPTAILLMPGSLVDGARAALRELGCPYTDRMDDAMRVVSTAVEYGRAMRTTPAGRAEGDAAPKDILLPDAPGGRLTESEAKALVAHAGIASPEERFAPDADGAVRAARAIGYPVVMKGVCRDVSHKSDAGAVKLALADDEAVRRAWTEIARGMAQAHPGAAIEGCTVQRMVRGGVELMLGTRWDATFGAVVVVGAGGVYVELLDDVGVALAPIDVARARSLLAGLRIAPLLDGARGRPRLDIDAAADACARLSALAAALGPHLAELDVNPLLVQARGVVALDARATLGPRNA